MVPTRIEFNPRIDVLFRPDNVVAIPIEIEPLA